MNILAIETATEACSAALAYQDQLFTRYMCQPKQHGQQILPMIDSLLVEAGCALTDLDGLAFGRGPGSFTGVRIAASVIQGLAFATNLGVVPISTLRTLAQSAYRKFGAHTVLAAIDARMQQVYWGNFQLDDHTIMCALSAEQVSAPCDVSTQAEQGIGSGWTSYAEQLPVVHVHHDCYPEAEDVVLLAQVDFAAGKAVPAEQALPVYLRDNVVN